MGTEDKRFPFVADTDNRALAFRADVRNILRAMEMEFRVAMEEMLRALPPDMADILRPHMEAKVPARFIKAALPGFEALSEMREETEMLRALLKKGPDHGMN